MFPMTITINNREQLDAVLAALGVIPSTAAPTTEKTVDKAPPAK